ncbi:MAG: FAD:protein FMN transferase [Clostridia bacterium]|nr:FAD:protein FMN transferase [Clostridia bacterium]
MKRLAIVLCLFCLLGLLASFAGCSQNNAQSTAPRGIVYFDWFDTVTTIYSYAGDPAEQFEQCSAGISGILSEYHKLFDIYNEYSGINNLCTVNKNAGGESVKVDPKLVEFLLYAVDMYGKTQGEMSVMMGSVLSLWHDCRSLASEDPSKARLPDEQALAEAALHTDISCLEIDEVNCTVRISDPLARIDVGALGKGYAAEKAAEYLEGLGVEHYILDVGGNIRVIGDKSEGKGFSTAIKDPLDPDTKYAAVVELKDTACVTSGVYERFFNVDGKQYHHIIDKDTLYPAEYFLSVSIITRDSGLADALSTALFCMSYEDGKELVNGLEGVEVIWIDHGGNMLCTDGIADMLVEGY